MGIVKKLEFFCQKASSYTISCLPGSMGKLFDRVPDENLSILDRFHSFIFCQSPVNGSMHQDGCEHVADLSGFEACQVLQALLCFPCVVKEALLSLGCDILQWFHFKFRCWSVV